MKYRPRDQVAAKLHNFFGGEIQLTGAEAVMTTGVNRVHFRGTTFEGNRRACSSAAVTAASLACMAAISKRTAVSTSKWGCTGRMRLTMSLFLVAHSGMGIRTRRALSSPKGRSRCSIDGCAFAGYAGAAVTARTDGWVQGSYAHCRLAETPQMLNAASAFFGGTFREAKLTGSTTRESAVLASQATIPSPSPLAVPPSATRPDFDQCKIGGLARFSLRVYGPYHSGNRVQPIRSTAALGCGKLERPRFIGGANGVKRRVPGEACRPAKAGCDRRGEVVPDCANPPLDEPATVGTPRSLCPPLFFRMATARTGGGK